MKRIMTIGLGLVFVLAATGNASLGTVDLANYSYSYADQATVTGGTLSGVTGYTGVYQWTTSNPTGLGNYVPNWGFCTELSQGTATGLHTVETLENTPNYTAAKADAVRELWYRYFDSSWATGSNKQYAEAFNACIWEIVYETDAAWDVTAGSGFYATGIEQSATANTWLTSLGGAGPRATNLYVLHDGQDFVVQVPEPATLLILGLGSLLLPKRLMPKRLV